MANNYLQFSEILDSLTERQEAWLKDQLESIVVIQGINYADGDAPECEAPDYCGLRFLRDYEDINDDANVRGFSVDFLGNCGERRAWLYAEESGDPSRVAHLVRKFLQNFRVDQCWWLTYATTCSKPRTGEFGGGAVFVTAEEIHSQNSYDFIEQERAAFLAMRGQSNATT